MRNTAGIVCILVAAVLTVCLTFERQACAKLNQDNSALRREVSQMEQLVAENQRISNLVSDRNVSSAPVAPSSQGPSAADEPAKELARLRSEVETLQKQSKEIEAMRVDTREARAAAENTAKTKHATHLASGSPGGSTSASQFEVLSADYWTEKTNIDVAAELRDRIRGDSLKAIANNNLKGDPEFGQVKHLTVVYRFGGATFTNEFREGDYIVLPPQPEQ
jgi:hypothetical protein